MVLHFYIYWVISADSAVMRMYLESKLRTSSVGGSASSTPTPLSPIASFGGLAGLGLQGAFFLEIWLKTGDLYLGGLKLKGAMYFLLLYNFWLCFIHSTYCETNLVCNITMQPFLKILTIECRVNALLQAVHCSTRLGYWREAGIAARWAWLRLQRWLQRPQLRTRSRLLQLLQLRRSSDRRRRSRCAWTCRSRISCRSATRRHRCSSRYCRSTFEYVSRSGHELKSVWTIVTFRHLLEKKLI